MTITLGIHCPIKISFLTEYASLNSTLSESYTLPGIRITNLILHVAVQEGVVETNLAKFWYN